MMTLAAVEAIIKALGRALGAPESLLPSFGHNCDAAQPEVQVDAAGYHFVVVERGEELQHKVFQQLTDLLKEVFEGVTFSMAVEYEVRYRIEGQDFRLLLFAKQVELLAQLDVGWAAQCRTAADQLLARKLP